MRKSVPREEWVGCIDPPGPFAPLPVQRSFLASLDNMPDGDLVRQLREEAMEYIRMMEEHPGCREPNDLN